MLHRGGAPPTSAMLSPGPASPVASWRRLVTVMAQGVASGTPLMVGSKLLQGWLTASGVPLALIGLIPLAELPYTLKLFWAPLLDRWPIPWPDRRRGWILVMQALLVLVIAGLGLMHPGTDPFNLLLIGEMALLLAICSATQDIVVDAYRTDLLPEAERGPGAAAAALGYRAAMLAVGAGGFLLAGRFGWSSAFFGASLLMAAVIPFTLAGPKLAPVQHAVTSLRQAVLGPAREFLRRAGPRRSWQLLLLVLLYRWPDGLLSAMAIPFLKLQEFSDAQIGLVQGGWAIGATMVGGHAPIVVTIDAAGHAGCALHQAMCAVPITEPMMKKNNVSSIRALPPPTVNSVPEAQPPPSCTPMPKMNAPKATPTPIGDTEPRTVWPNSDPDASTGKNTAHVSASINIWARRPAPRRSAMNTRQAEVKPNAAW